MTPETHHLKILPKFFEDVISGRKKFEVRKRDRLYLVGDVLVLHEADPRGATGREAVVDVTYILQGGFFGVDPDYCIMSIELRDDLDDIFGHLDRAEELLKRSEQLANNAENPPCPMGAETLTKEASENYKKINGALLDQAPEKIDLTDPRLLHKSNTFLPCGDSPECSDCINGPDEEAE